MTSYIYITGGKGGIGKSLAAITIADYKSTQGPVTLVDGDPVNGDSSAAYQSAKDTLVTPFKIQLRSEDASGQSDPSGILETLNLLSTETPQTVVVDAPAGDTMLLTHTANVIIEGCKSVGICSVIVWLIDSLDRTPANTLHTAWDSIKDADKILLIKNLRKGSNFEQFDKSDFIRGITELPNVSIMEYPKIPSRLEENIRIDRMNWFDLTTKTPLGNRMEAIRLRKSLHAALEECGV